MKGPLTIRFLTFNTSSIELLAVDAKPLPSLPSELGDPINYLPGLIHYDIRDPVAALDMCPDCNSIGTGEAFQNTLTH